MVLSILSLATASQRYGQSFDLFMITYLPADWAQFSARAMSQQLAEQGEDC
jgi:hypothetical protein